MRGTQHAVVMMLLPAASGPRLGQGWAKIGSWVKGQDWAGTVHIYLCI